MRRLDALITKLDRPQSPLSISLLHLSSLLKIYLILFFPIISKFAIQPEVHNTDHLTITHMYTGKFKNKKVGGRTSLSENQLPPGIYNLIGLLSPLLSLVTQSWSSMLKKGHSFFLFCTLRAVVSPGRTLRERNLRSVASGLEKPLLAG